MKKLLLIALAALFAACGDGEKAAEQSEVLNSKPAAQNTAQPGQITIAKSTAPVAANYDSYDIDGQKRIKFGIGESTPETRAIGAVALVRKPLESINKQLIRAKLGRDFIVRCSACHDDYANGIIGPSLLNKTGDEIYEMIKKYKNRDKPNALMVALVDQMSDEAVRRLADEIAEFNKPFRSTK